ncbi:MAG: AarF/ABC1/UbiB kinase family protein [Nitrospirae bacterium]|nr:AarF/ABC1/UbiB kinase family protein [Nitrospirota bacterium]
MLRLRRTYKSVSRIRQIINVFLKHGFGQFVEEIRLHRFIPLRKRLKVFGYWPEIERHTIPERLRLAFSELGPSFIKLAQILSARPDLITKAYADEFKKLLDEVPPFPSEKAKKIIEEELKTPIKEMFADFEDSPVAAASIAQVHKATLREGDKVIVKVQRPEIRELIETDISILNVIARLMVKYIPESKFFNPTGIVNEFTRTVRKELDFIEEARNACRFRRNFEEDPHICIPKIYPDLISEKVIVMERLEGVRVDNIEGIEALGLDRTELARVGVDAYFKMMLEDGFFHADPHPGNIFILPDGRIGLMDFGIVGWLTPELMDNIANAFLALVTKDFDRLVDQYIEFGMITEETDIDAFRKDFKADLVDFLVPLYGLTIAEINFAQYLDTITHLAIKHDLTLPSDLLLVNKSMLILDNIGRQLDPNFNFIAVAEPYASKIARRRISPAKLLEKARKNLTELGDFLVSTPKNMKVLMRKAMKDNLHLKITPIGFEKLIKDLDRSSNRIAFSVIVGAIIVGSSLLIQSGVGEKIFGLPAIGAIGFAIAFVLGIWLLISIIKSGRL